MADIFHEVDEEVRRERLQKLWERYSIYIIALAVLIVAAIGAWRGYEYWQAKKGRRRRRRIRGRAQSERSRASTPRRMRPSPRSPPRRLPAIALLARLRAAAELAQTKPADAVKAYDELAADASLGRRRCRISPPCAPAC